MKNITKKLLPFTSTIGLLITFLPQKVLAADNLKLFGFDFGHEAQKITFEDILRFVIYIGSNLIGLAGLVAVIFIIWGGIKLIYSKGNQEQATAAKNTLTWAIIGFVVAIIAYLIVQTFLQEITTVDLDRVNY
ncbi:MAG: pilin [Patescibacteria group bacterium]